MRSWSQKPLNASISDVEGVIGYQAPIVAPAYTQPRAAAVLPSMMMCPRVAVAELDGLHVGLDQLRFFGVGLPEQRTNDVQIQLAQRREHPDVADVLHQNARAHAREVVVAQARQWHADDRHVIAFEQRRPRPGRSEEHTSELQ